MEISNIITIIVYVLSIGVSWGVITNKVSKQAEDSWFRINSGWLYCLSCVKYIISKVIPQVLSITSANIAKIKSYYDKRLWKTSQVRDAVVKGWITEEQFTEITGEAY